ncbi:MAG: hypothetical protein IPN80_11675 [Flavobacterium sp.]|nr:hypothetical protein [Flavobacterium sp.]
MKEKFQSKRLKLFFTLILGCTSLTSVGQIIISQVYNGVGNNKCIEITNIGDNLDLSSWSNTKLTMGKCRNYRKCHYFW